MNAKEDANTIDSHKSIEPIDTINTANAMDTICAPATPHGRGAVSLIRISGSKTQYLLEKIFQPRQQKKIKPWQAIYGHLVKENKILDEVIVLFFAKPHSYTTQDMAEIYCHGNPIIVRQILEYLLLLGARMAKPGEFTEQAYWGGRIDLTQAEAVHSLISAHSEKELELWLQNTNGFFRDVINQLRQKMIDFMGDVEAEIDFGSDDSDEETQPTSSHKNKITMLQNIVQEIENLLTSGRLGQNIQNGFQVAIIGRPNVGKSSLMNALLNQDRSIVSAMPGTTRDIISENIEINGFMFRFFDTAGIRELAETQNFATTSLQVDIESLGINKTKKLLEQVDLLLILMDAVSGFVPQDLDLLADLPDKPRLYTINKIDQGEYLDIDYWQKHIHKIGKSKNQIAFISALESKGLDDLESKMTAAAGYNDIPDDTLLMQERVRDLLTQIIAELHELDQLIRENNPPEILAIPLRQCIEYIGSITGQIHNEEILGSIFRRFCIGK